MYETKITQLARNALPAPPARLREYYLRQHGEKKGRQIAYALLEDLMEAGPLKVAPSLSFLGLAVGDELCARHITSPVLH